MQRSPVLHLRMKILIGTTSPDLGRSFMMELQHMVYLVLLHVGALGQLVQTGGNSD